MEVFFPSLPYVEFLLGVLPFRRVAGARGRDSSTREGICSGGYVAGEEEGEGKGESKWGEEKSGRSEKGLVGWAGSAWVLCPVRTFFPIFEFR